MTSIREEIRALASLAWPISAAQIGLVSLSLVDVAILGRVSVTELAGASIGRAVTFIAISIALGVAQALDPLAAQAVGAKEPARAWSAMIATIKACVLVLLPCVALAMIATANLDSFGIDPALVSRAEFFVLGQVPGLVAYLIFTAGKSFLQANGSTRPALVASAVANVINVVVCSLVVRGDAALAVLHLPPLGLRAHGAFGAGFSGSIASIVLAAAIVPSVLKYAPKKEADNTIQRAPESRPHVDVRRVLVLGAPIGFQFLAEIGVFSCVGVIAGRLGSVAVSANQIAIGLASCSFMGALGFSEAAAVRVGNAVGAGMNARRPGFVGISLGVVFMSCSAIGFAIFAEPLSRLFTEDEAVITLSTSLLRVAAAFQVFDGMQGVASGALRGAGDVRYPFVASAISYWGIGLPLSLLFAFVVGLGAVGLWLGLTAGLVVVSIALVRRFAVISARKIARV